MLVFFEAVAVALGALVLRQELLVRAQQLPVTNLVGPYDPEMCFALTDFRTSPRRR